MKYGMTGRCPALGFQQNKKALRSDFDMKLYLHAYKINNDSCHFATLLISLVSHLPVDLCAAAAAAATRWVSLLFKATCAGGTTWLGNKFPSLAVEAQVIGLLVHC